MEIKKNYKIRKNNSSFLLQNIFLSLFILLGTRPSKEKVGPGKHRKRHPSLDEPTLSQRIIEVRYVGQVGFISGSHPTRISNMQSTSLFVAA